MRSAIIEKLRSELSAPIQAERQVVYILVQVRKVIEQIKEDATTNPFCSLELYCNWAVHPWLDRTQARDLLKKVDMLYSKLFGCGLNEEEHNRLSNILNFNEFRIELDRFLREHELPTDMCADEDKWHNFLSWYSQVIEDCPLVCRSDDPALRMIDKIVFTKVDPVEGIRPSANRVAGFSINWEFFYRNRPLGVVVLTPEHKLLGSKFYAGGADIALLEAVKQLR